MRVLVLALLAAGCSSEASARDTFAGEYEVISYGVRTPCEGAVVPGEVSPTDKYFRLADEELAGQPIVAYYECSAPGVCDDIYDLAKTVGDGPGGWTLNIASAGGTPCRLTFRRRVLVRTSDGVSVEQTAYQVEDASAVCTSDEAKRRGMSMPCVETKVWAARKR